MKTNIKARITCLFISKTTIIINKREIIYFIISISSFLISLILSSSFTYIFLFFPYLFRFNFVVSEQNVHILFCRHIWAELSLLSWTFLSGTFFPSGGGGGARVHPVHPPAYAPVFALAYCTNNHLKDVSWICWVR